MNKIFTSLFLFLFIYNSNAQTGYKINVNLKQFSNQYIYLGYYFGKTLPIKDSIKLDANGNGFFTGKEKLPGGIYLIGYPSKNKFFEILIDKNQFFSFTADTANIEKSLKLKNTDDGVEFQNYQSFMGLKGKQINTINSAPNITLDQQKQNADKKKKINEEVQQYRKAILQKSPKSLLSSIFKTIEEPIIPASINNPKKASDSTLAWYYYKSNYWNGVDFKDDRLLRTPVFEPKFDNYFKDVVYPLSDSIIKEVDKIILASLPNKEMFKYVTSKLIERYVNPQYMGQDAVYVHLFEKYIATNMTTWYDEKQKKFLFDRGYSLMANLIGDKAAPLELVDTFAKPVSLYNIKSDYTIVCFWDATCGHCKEVVPKLDSIYTQNGASIM